MNFSVWICIGKADGNYCAYAPEVPGCMAADDTIEETEEYYYLVRVSASVGEPVEA